RWVNSLMEGYRSIAEASTHVATERFGSQHGGGGSLQNLHIAQARPVTLAPCRSVWPRKRSIVRERKLLRIDCRKQSGARSGGADSGYDLFALAAREAVSLRTY